MTQCVNIVNTYILILPKIFRKNFTVAVDASVAAISNALNLKTFWSARAFVLKVGKSNSFDMCSGCSKVYVVCFFLLSVDFYK